MDSLAWNRFDILEICRHYCDIRSGNVYTYGEKGYRQDDESQRAKFSKEALAQLSKSVESRKNQRHNISEDTWQQVLAFSRCVHVNLEGYDPEGAWPVLIDDFVEHMYSISGINHNPNLFCNHGVSEAQSADTLHGLRFFPDLKRKLPDDFQVPMVTSDTNCPDSTGCKRSRHTAHKTENWEDNPPGPTANDSVDIIKHNSTSCSSDSLCAVEAKGLCRALLNTLLFAV